MPEILENVAIVFILLCAFSFWIGILEEEYQDETDKKWTDADNEGGPLR